MEKPIVRVVAACVLAACTANAADFTLLNGKTDWTDPSSYKDNAGSAVPGASDRIFTEDDATNSLLPGNEKYAASLNKINEVVQVQLGKRATLVIEVADGVTNTITGRIGSNSSQSKIEEAATLVKRGGGTLLQEPSESANYYFARWQVEAGTLGAPWATSPEAAQKNIYCYGIDLAADTELILSYKQNFQVLGPLTGSGAIYTLNPNSQNTLCSPLYLQGGPGAFAGTIGTNIYVHVRDAILDFTGTANRYNGGLDVSGFNDDGTDKGVLGFVKFGATASDPSSLGLRGTVTLGEYYNNVPMSGAFRYLGTTGESVTGKYINFGYTQDAPATFDAGAHGGLSFGSGVQWSVSEAHNQRFCLTGSNTVECTFAGKFVEGANGSVYLIKKGSGTWHLKENSSSELSGPVCVEDGVLRHNTLASRGDLCALGTAANLHDGAYVASAGATAVDYAILFAGEGNGLLEYTGLYDACSSNRPVAVKTSGGFSSAAGAERIHGISAYDGAETATLVILATNNAISTYADITDGTHGGKLGVTKRGSGTAEIDRELSFSGPLNVEEGKLIVRNSSGPYTWFRLIVKENVAVRDSLTDDATKLNQVTIERFALYDADGVRQNVGLTRHDGNLQVKGYSSQRGHVVKSAASGLRPGEIGYDRTGNVYVWSNRDIQNMCDGTHGDSNDYLCYTRYDGGDKLSLSNPNSWVKYVMRLTNGAPEIASFDIAARFGTTDVDNKHYAPVTWTLEGSVDGVNWNVLTNTSISAGTTIVGKTWYSDGASCYGTLDGRRWQEGKSFPIRGTPETPASFNVLGNCESVSVAPGAVLEKQGSAPVAISSLVVSTNGFGRIEGFSFAESGSIKVTGIESLTTALEIPGEFVGAEGLGNLSRRGWRVSINGKDKYTVVKATSSGLTISPHGFILIYR